MPRGMHQFFDIKRFLEGKSLQVTGVGKWTHFDTNELLGTRVDVVIVADNTEYRETSSGATISNLYERLSLKVARNNITVPIGALVVPVDAVATVYGNRYNQLSIKCADIKVVSQPKG